MNPTAKVRYDGELRTTATHTLSQHQITTDAPPDNRGKGEAFAPIDLLATSLLTCMITAMGILAEKKEIRLGNVSGEVEIFMASGPRRVSALLVDLQFEDQQLSEVEKALLEDAAINCPVAKSIHPDIAVNIRFGYH
jgi:putative redox protein